MAEGFSIEKVAETFGDTVETIQEILKLE